MSKPFDLKFGEEFVAHLPAAPGIYRVYNSKGILVYVGKAKNLKRRIAQYRNAKRARKDRKMRKIVGDAARWEWELCASPLEAELTEARLIQEFRPKWNVAGAFSFLYPYVGVGESEGVLRLCLTTLPQEVNQQGSSFRFFGVYRSREMTSEAFLALGRLLQFVGHSNPVKRRAVKYTSEMSLRGLKTELRDEMESFFLGESCQFLETLSLSLLENAGARARAREVEEDLKALRRFFIHESHKLSRVCHALGIGDRLKQEPIAQAERDLIFLRFRSLRDSSKNFGQPERVRQ